MTRTLAHHPKRNRLRVALFGFIAAVIYIGNLRLVVPSDLSPEFIALGVAIDLVAWVPLLYYLMVQRSGAGPAFITRLLVVAGLLVTFTTVPESALLTQIRTAYPMMVAAIAAAALTFMIMKATRAWPRVRILSGEARIDALSAELFGDAGFGRVIRSEWLCLHYALFGWKQPQDTDQRIRFSHDRNSGAVGTLLAMSILHIPGLFFWHLIVMHAWPGIALVFTALHVYTTVFTVGQAMAIRHRHLEPTDQGLKVRYGLFFENLINYGTIERVERATWSDLEQAPGRLRATLAGDVNVKIVFREPQRMIIVAGLSKPCTELVLGVDAPTQLMAALQARELFAAPNRLSN
ncbi:MAG: hypothetical protein AAGJ52_00425 [Pseudomonadota bacterium]